MSVIPAKEKLTFYQGSTFDETWTFYEDDAETTLSDFTGWSAALMVRKDLDSAAPLMDLEDGATPPSTDGLVLGDAAGTVRIYVRDETLAALSHTSWTDEDGTYTGVWQLELTNPEGETFRYAGGVAVFSREVVR